MQRCAHALHWYADTGSRSEHPTIREAHFRFDNDENDTLKTQNSEKQHGETSACYSHCCALPVRLLSVVFSSARAANGTNLPRSPCST